MMFFSGITPNPDGTKFSTRSCKSSRKSVPPKGLPQFSTGLPARLRAVSIFVRVSRNFFCEASAAFLKEVRDMRRMKNINTGEVLNVAEHIITKNLWEFYVFDYFLGSSNVNALVMGFETEIGLVSMDELGPHILTKTKDLTEVAAATGWEWV